MMEEYVERRNVVQDKNSRKMVRVSIAMSIPNKVPMERAVR